MYFLKSGNPIFISEIRILDVKNDFLISEIDFLIS